MKREMKKDEIEVKSEVFTCGISEKEKDVVIEHSPLMRRRKKRPMSPEFLHRGERMSIGEMKQHLLLPKDIDELSLKYAWPK